MTNVVETARWEDGIYQFETSDPVVGGPDGIDNLPTRQLANRTLYLKGQVEARQSDLAAHVSAGNPHPQYATKTDLAQRIADLVGQSPAELDTLYKLAAAMGNDPSFATTMVNALSQKAPLDSPTFSGKPKGTTPAQFDSSTRVATTEFVQRALGNFQTAVQLGVNATTVLTASQAGTFVQVQGGNVTLPAGAGLLPGATFWFFSSGTTSLYSANGDVLAYASSSQATGFGLGPGDFLGICYIGVFNGKGTWEVVAGSAALAWSAAFANSMGIPGYQRFPGGMIIQWGGFMSSGTGNPNAAITFPIAFPNACLSVSPTIGGGSVGNFTVQTYAATKGGATLSCQNNSAMSSGVGGNYVAIGF